MQVCTLLQTDNHNSTPTTLFFTGRMPFLPPNQQLLKNYYTNGTKIWLLIYSINIPYFIYTVLKITSSENPQYILLKVYYSKNL